MITVIWLIVPGQAVKTNYLYHRFALYLLPAYVFLFRRREAPDARTEMSNARAMLVPAALALTCAWFFGSLALRERRFVAEAAPFEDVLSAAEPGQRALSLIFETSSPTVHHPWTYHSYPLWYQAERKGFVDFNFACLLPQIVRFRPERLPALRPRPGFESNPKKFDWNALDAGIYRYYFVRHTTPLSPGMFDNDECKVALVKESGEWALFERRECRK